MDPSYLVVVIPGIGGSELALPENRNKRLWTTSFGSIAKALARPAELSISEHPHLQPVDLIKTRRAFGIWTAIQGYDTLLTPLAIGENALPKALLDAGTAPKPDLAANVVAAYDFRPGVASAANELDRAIRHRLEHLWPNRSDRANKVFIVAHSMGGLVARYWAAQSENRRLCRLILTLGTPHRGAPKALDLLANGLAVMGHHVVKWPVPMLREWQSLYDLLPRYPAVALHSTASSDKKSIYPKDLDARWLNQKRASDAFTMHEAIREAWADPAWEANLTSHRGSALAMARCRDDLERLDSVRAPKPITDLGCPPHEPREMETR